MSDTPRRRARPRLTYANITSTLALFIALGTGTAYAAATIGSAQVINESLTGADIKNGSLTGYDIADNRIGTADVVGLRSADVLDNTLRGVDVLDNSLSGADIADGTIGSDDVAGLLGDDIVDGSIGGADLSSDSVSGAQLADSSVTSSTIADGSIAFDDLTAYAKNQLLPSAYVVNGIADVTAVSEPRQVVFSKTVPAGSYVVQLAGSMYNASLDDRGTNCIVTIGGTNAGTIAGETLRGNDGTEDNQEEYAIVGQGTLGAPGTIALECIAPSGTVSVGGTLTALRVSGVS
jgi:hypothetical protein